jgi:dienelactone hydrolase
MKQILLALGLVLAPVAAFTGFQLLRPAATEAQAASPGAVLGDLSAMKTIVADVAVIAAKGDLAAAATRITDFESAWDDAESGMRPMNPDAWGKADHAADTALKALRAKAPDAAAVKSALEALLARLDNPAA